MHWRLWFQLHTPVSRISKLVGLVGQNLLLILSFFKEQSKTAKFGASYITFLFLLFIYLFFYIIFD